MWICMWRTNWMRLVWRLRWWMRLWMIGGRFASPWARRDSNKSALLTASPPPRWKTGRNSFTLLCLYIPLLTQAMCVLGWQTHWLCSGPDSGKTYWSGEEEEQGRSVRQTLPGGCTHFFYAVFLTQDGFIIENDEPSCPCCFRWRTTSGCLWTHWSRTPPLTLRPRRTWHSRPRALGPSAFCQTSLSEL